jgi:hypothetical protein
MSKDQTMSSPITTKARTAGFFYLLTFVTGFAALAFRSSQTEYGTALTLISDACYVAVTILFYEIFKPVSRSLSLFAAIVGLTGCIVSALTLLHFATIPINALGIFGVYCILIGYLIDRSRFLPRWLGGLMVLGGLAWLTFLSPPLARALAPFNYMPGIIAEGALTIRLLALGITAGRARGRTTTPTAEAA